MVFEITFYATNLFHASFYTKSLRQGKYFCEKKKSWQSNLAISTSLIIGSWLSFRNRVFTVIPSQSSCTRNSSTSYFIFITNTHTKKYKVTDNVSVLKSNKKCISEKSLDFARAQFLINGTLYPYILNMSHEKWFFTINKI